MTRRVRRDAGFTLIETIVTLAVLGLVLALVIGRGPMRSRTLDARASAGEVAGALRSARARAIASNRPVRFVLDVRQHRYALDDEAPRALPSQLGVAITGVSGSVAGDRGAISFAPDGSSTGGRIDLADGPRRWQIGVDWLTGRVRVADAK